MYNYLARLSSRRIKWLKLSCSETRIVWRLRAQRETHRGERGGGGWEIEKKQRGDVEGGRGEKNEGRGNDKAEVERQR